MGSVIPPEIIEEIKARSDIVEIVGSFVQLKRAGSTNFKGLCPFHQEKTPSFHVDSARQMYHCFGCGKGGDVVRFLMDKENLTFVDALHMLASRAGIIIPEYNRQISKEKVDYRKVLSAEDFEKFRILRECRKTLAVEEAVPAYAIFLDEQLAAVAQQAEINAHSLKSVDGIGDKKMEKYGKRFLELWEQMRNETGGKSVLENSGN